MGCTRRQGKVVSILDRGGLLLRCVDIPILAKLAQQGSAFWRAKRIGGVETL